MPAALPVLPPLHNAIWQMRRREGEREGERREGGKAEKIMGATKRRLAQSLPSSPLSPEVYTVRAAAADVAVITRPRAEKASVE